MEEYSWRVKLPFEINSRATLARSRYVGQDPLERSHHRVFGRNREYDVVESKVKREVEHLSWLDPSEFRSVGASIVSSPSMRPSENSVRPYRAK